MDEASVEQAIKDKLLVDERLLKRLVKASQQSSTEEQTDNLKEEFLGHSEKLQTYTNAALADISYFEQESVNVRNEYIELQARMTRMRTLLHAEREAEPQFEEVQKLHLQLKQVGERNDLLSSIQEEEMELEKLKTQIIGEENRIKALKDKLETFLNQFRTNE